MKKYLLIVTFLFTILNWGQTFEWAASNGSSDLDFGYSVTTDNFDNVITTGFFRDVVDFDPGIGVENLTAVGFNDVFIQKLDSEGNFVWAKSFGGSSIDYGHAIATDEFGNIYSTGYFLGTVDFDPGPGIHEVASSGVDIFVHKLDADGNFQWVKSFGNIYGDIGFSITVDPSNNVLVTGTFVDTVDFDPGAGVYNLTTELDVFDFFVLKLDADGNFIWANSSDSGVEEASAHGIITDELGNVYATGHFTGTVDFEQGVGETVLTSFYRDVFVIKYDEDGNFLWVKSFGGFEWDIGNSIGVDGFGNVYTTGGFHSTVDFDPGVGTSELTASSEGAFIHKMDSDGNFLWVKPIDGSGDDRGLSLSVDASGDVYSTGLFADNIDFDPGPEVYSLTSEGGWDAYIQKLDSEGNLLWVHSMGSTGNDIGHSILKDEGNVYLTGYFSNTVDFDPSAEVYDLTSEGSADVFTLKMGDCANTGIDTITSCDSYVWIDGVEYFEDTVGATFILTNELGCDSVVTLNFTLLSSASIDELTVCDSLTWTDGITYYSDNFMATDTFTNVLGCDSVVTLNLIINNSSESVDTQIACDSFTWIDGEVYTEDNNTATYSLTNALGCDSIVTLDLTVNYSTETTDVQLACNSFIWIDGETYTEDNTTATYTLTSEAGCDSVVNLDLTIHDIDLTVINEDPTLTATELDAEYQWLDCLNDYEPIPGENGISFTPDENGEYAVEITKYGCSDTSICVAISTIGITQNEKTDIFVYPNPSRGQLTISGLRNFNYQLVVYSILGEVVLEQEISNKAFVELELPKGQYLLILIGDDGVRHFKVTTTG